MVLLALPYKALGVVVAPAQEAEGDLLAAHVHDAQAAVVGAQAAALGARDQVEAVDAEASEGRGREAGGLGGSLICPFVTSLQGGADRAGEVAEARHTHPFPEAALEGRDEGAVLGGGALEGHTVPDGA